MRKPRGTEQVVSAVSAEAPGEGADSTARVVLRPGRARPLWYGHPWVYANAVHRLEGTAAPGDAVTLVDSDGRFIGRGLWNPRSQIPVRLITRRDEAIDAALISKRIERARAMRARLGLPSKQTTSYRLCNSEGDELPGLVVDVFGDALVVQVTTLGMWLRRAAIFDAIEAQLAPRTIFEAGSAGFGDVEGFHAAARVARGESRALVSCREDGIELEVDPMSGQKTGMFLDQRPNRVRVGALAKGARVLDLYSYAGGFALQAARGGAAQVTAVDSSARAVARVEAHAALNDLAIKVTEADAFRYLETAPPRSFDLVVVDPPKFARARRDLEAARKGYERLNALALGACAPNAILVTCSCSQNVSQDEFERVLAAAAKAAGREVSIVDRCGTGADHPLPPGFSEGQYLKVLFVYVN